MDSASASDPKAQIEQQARTIRLMRLAMVGALLVPALLFGYAALVSYRSARALAEERLLRSLDVQHEQLLKAFQLVDLTLDRAGDLIAGLSESDIRNEEERLHQQFTKLTGTPLAIQSVWVYGPTGWPLVTSWEHPPPQQSFSDRDFFQAHLHGEAGTYYGRVYTSVLGGQSFFT
jgi:two-component system NtrC family sensor kinase